MSKFVNVCNGRIIPICSQGCERTKGSMSPHVLKWILPLSWKTFVAVKNPTYRQHSTTRGCMKMMMFLHSLCPQIEWGTNGLPLTCLPFSSAPSFGWTQACPWFLWSVSSLIFPQASVSGISSLLQSANSTGSFADLSSILYLWRQSTPSPH